MSCFNLEDTRDAQGKGRVVNSANGRIYGHMTKDSNAGLREKFALLSLIQAPVMLLGRIPYRIYGVLSGDFIDSGVKAAKKEWQLKQQQWSLQSPVEKSSIKLGYNFIAAKHVTWHLLKNICKIVTLPLAIVAQQFAALYGLINPLDGRILFSAINDLWSRAIIPMHGTRFRAEMLHISDYLGFCLQPKDVWDNKKIYRIYPDYNPQTIRSLLSGISAELRDKQVFFQNEGVDVESILSQLLLFQKNVTNVSYSDQSEVHKNGLLEAPTRDQKAARDGFQAIIANLVKIEQSRQSIATDLASNVPDIDSHIKSREQAKLEIKQNLERLAVPFLVKS